MNKERFQKIAGILKEASDKQPSSISAKSPLSVAILKKVFEKESPKTKYRIKNGDFEFDFKSFCENYQNVGGISEDRAWKEIFLPVAKTIRLIDRWADIEDVILINN
jgi:hypothetical protein